MAQRKDHDNMKDHIPPPSLQHLCKLQLMRTTLVKFLDWKNFDDVVRGCFVRVLLEMRNNNNNDGPHEPPENYYIAMAKGAQKGPEYTGFSWDGVSTGWHIIIELPSCFRSTPSGNIVQLNSVSNTTFKPKEYVDWVQMTKQSRAGFMTISQIELRLQVMQEHFKEANIMPTPAPRKRRMVDDDPAKVAAREAAVAQMAKSMEEQLRAEHVLLPHIDTLPQMPVEQLQEVERECLDLMSTIRMAINERTKCRICKCHVCAVVFYPCKHQVVCRNCINAVDVCPVADCGQRIDDRFEAYSS